VRGRLVPAAAAALLVAGGLCGCTGLKQGDLQKMLYTEKPQPQTPESIEAVWTNTTLHQPGHPPTRGFGGRLLFFGKNQDRSVLVDGNLVVYAFDDDKPDPEHPQPEKKFVFPAEDLAKHQSESPLGPSYSVWLPWDQVGGRARRISLIARFEHDRGTLLASNVAHVALTGEPAAPPARTTPPRPRAERQPDGVQPASYSDTPAPEGNRAARKTETATIPVAPGQAQRLFTGTSDAGKDATGRASAAAEQAAPPATRSALDQPPARNSAAVPRAADRARTRPALGESLRRLPSTPRSGWNRSARVPSADDAATPD
jgi:hypothetical protein